MSARQRILLFPLLAVLNGVAASAAVGLVSDSASGAAVAAAVLGSGLACLRRWNARALGVVALAVALVAPAAAGTYFQHMAPPGTGLVQAITTVNPIVDGFLIGASVLLASLTSWLVTERQPWGATVVLGATFVLRCDVDWRFASWLPLLVIGCLLLIVLANAESPRDVGRASGVLTVAGMLIAVCWQIPTPVPAWSRSFIDPLAALVGNRYGPSISQALVLSGQFHPSDQLVMSIRTAQPVTHPYWRLAVFDHYDGHLWTPTSPSTELVGPRAPIVVGLDVSHADVVSATVTLDQPGTSLVSPGVPLAFSLPSHPAYVGGSPQPSSVSPVRVLPTGTIYRVSGVVSPIGSVQGRNDAAVALLPYMQTPDEPTRVQTLARRIVAGAVTPGQEAERLVRYLRDSGIFHYDINAGSPPDQDAVDAFLFGSHRGYCNQFASALAILAREIGLPSRLVTGYISGQYSHGRYLVRQRDAHSWVEIYLNGSGWVTFDPTPGFNAGAAEKTSAQSLGIVGRRAGVVPLPRPGATMLVKASQRGNGYRVPIPRPARSARIRGGANTPPWLPVLGLLLALSVVALVLWTRRTSADLYAALAGGRSKTGLRIRPQETPLEFVERFQGRAEYADARLIVDLYIRERYAGLAPSAEERRAVQEAWRRLQGRRIPVYSTVARR